MVNKTSGDKNRIAVELFNQLADQYQDQYMDLELYEESLDLICEELVEDAEILDVACGPGNITKYLMQQRGDFKLWGVDLASNMLDLARINNPDATFQILDARKIGNIKKSFDAVVCGFVMPYLSLEESVQMVFGAAKILKEQGYLYISTIEGDYKKSGYKKGSTNEGVFMYYYDEAFLTELIKRTGLEVIDVKRTSYLHKGEPTTDLMIVARNFDPTAIQDL